MGAAGRLARSMRAFVGDRRGNIAVIVALSAVPLIGISGLAVDYSAMLSTKAKLDQAADAAAVASVTGAQTYIKSYTGTSDATAAAESSGQAQGLAQFNANTGRLPSGTLPAPSIQVTTADGGATLVGQVNYSFTMPTTFLSVLGHQTMTINGSSTSTLTMPTYINVYVVLDVSSSMGIGATAADQKIVYNATGCAVACHYDTTEATAHSKGAVLRIDVAKQAIAAGLAKIPTNSTYKVAVYTASDALTQVYALSNDVTGAINAVNSIDLAAGNNDGGTDTTSALQSLASKLPATGNGQTSTAARGIVMFISDAVQDSDMKVCPNNANNCANPSDTSSKSFTVLANCSKKSTPPSSGATCWYDSNFGVYFEAIDPAQCDTLKKSSSSTNGYTVMTLDVQYLIPSSSMQGSSAFQQAFTFIQNNLVNSTLTNMKSCASDPDKYAFSANTPDEIATATNAMFGAIPTIAQARLSQ